MWPAGESGVKLQYNVAQTRRVNIARMRDDPTSVIGRYDIYTARLPIAASFGDIDLD